MDEQGQNLVQAAQAAQGYQNANEAVAARLGAIAGAPSGGPQAGRPSPDRLSRFEAHFGGAGTTALKER